MPRKPLPKPVTPPAPAIYMRVSTEDQIGGYGLDVQLERCTAQATVKGWIVAPEHIFADEGVSGTKDAGSIARGASKSPTDPATDPPREPASNSSARLVVRFVVRAGSVTPNGSSSTRSGVASVERWAERSVATAVDSSPAAASAM